jgi:hypothetical protein
MLAQAGCQRNIPRLLGDHPALPHKSVDWRLAVTNNGLFHVPTKEDVGFILPEVYTKMF